MRVIPVVLLLVLSVFVFSSGSSTYYPVEDSPCGPAEVVMVDVFEEFERMGTASAALFEYLQDRFDEAEGVLEYVLAGNPGTIGNPVEEVISRLPGSEQGDGITQWVIEYRDAYVGDPAKWVVEPNHVVVVTGPVTITATDSIWINGTVLSLWDALGNAPTLTFAAPEVHVNGLVATASAGIIVPDDWEVLDGVTQPGPLGDGGDLEILADDWSLGPSACMGTGNGADGAPMLTFPSSAWGSAVAGDGGAGGSILAQSWPDPSQLEGTISLGNGGDGGEAFAVGMVLTVQAIGGAGGASGELTALLGADYSGMAGTLIGAVGGNGGNASAQGCTPAECSIQAGIECADSLQLNRTDLQCILFGVEGSDEEVDFMSKPHWHTDGWSAPCGESGTSDSDPDGRDATTDGEEAPNGGAIAKAEGGPGGPGFREGGEGGSAEARGGAGPSGGSGGCGGSGWAGGEEPGIGSSGYTVGNGGDGTDGAIGSRGGDGIAIGGRGGDGVISGGPGGAAKAWSGRGGDGGAAGDGGAPGCVKWKEDLPPLDWTFDWGTGGMRGTPGLGGPGGDASATPGQGGNGLTTGPDGLPLTESGGSGSLGAEGYEAHAFNPLANGGEAGTCVNVNT